MTTPDVYPSKPCFFRSDSENEEEEKYSMQVDIPAQSAALDAESATSPRAITVAEVSDSKKRLFFASSDDEEDSVDIDIDAILQRRANEARGSPDRQTSPPRPRASSIVSSVKSRSSPAPVKKRKATPLTAKAPVPSNTKTSNKPVNQTKKTDGKPTAMSKSLGFESMYVGSFLVPNAWSTCKGRGWVQAGETIEINRTDDVKYSNKTTNGGQLKLTSMFKVKGQTAKPIKKGKEDNLIRFTNSRGFG